MDAKGKELIRRACAFAELKHAGITRKNLAQDPYTRHTQEVADLVEKSGGTAEEVAAAHLHDTREDTNTTHEEIARHFGERVAQIVDGLTDPPGIAFPSKLPTLERKRAQAKRLAHKSDSVKRCKLADQISNVRSVAYDPPVDWDHQKTVDYVEGARVVALECKGVSPMLDELFRDAYEHAAHAHSHS